MIRIAVLKVELSFSEIVQNIHGVIDDSPNSPQYHNHVDRGQNVNQGFSKFCLLIREQIRIINVEIYHVAFDQQQCAYHEWCEDCVDAVDVRAGYENVKDVQEVSGD